MEFNVLFHGQQFIEEMRIWLSFKSKWKYLEPCLHMTALTILMELFVAFVILAFAWLLSPIVALLIFLDSIEIKYKFKEN